MEGGGDAFVEESTAEEEEESSVPAPPKRTTKERFQRYLDKSGVSAAILRGIVSLYEDENKPNDPIRYLCEQWGFGIPEMDEVDALQAEVIVLRRRYEFLTLENEHFNLLTLPIPTPAEAMGLDDETQQFLRKQEEQLALIQRREACILKAYNEAKVRAAKELKIPICVPVHTGTQIRDDPTSEDRNSRDLLSPLVVEEVEEEEEEDQEVDREEDVPELKCSLDFLDDYVKGQSGDISTVSSFEGDTTITIGMEELKSHPRYTCGMTIQYTPK